LNEVNKTKILNLHRLIYYLTFTFFKNNKEKNEIYIEKKKIGPLRFFENNVRKK